MRAAHGGLLHGGDTGRRASGGDRIARPVPSIAARAN
jgi:hypothetical protein